MPQINTPPKKEMFRTDVLKGADRVDRTENVIFGANLMQVGDLNEGDSRFWTVDAESLNQALAFMEQGNNGTKARYTHPNMSSDGMGSYLGRWKNPRIDGDTLRGDLHVADSAFTSPQGDLGTYVLDLAEEDPEAFGVSLATRLDWGALQEFEDEQYEKRRLARKEDKPVPERERWPMRFTAIRAADVVDEPAATRGGFFSLDVDNRNLPAQATLLLDSYFSDAEPEVVTARINGFLTTYFKGKGKAMPETPAPEAPEINDPPKPESVDLAAVQAEAADLGRKEERERQTQITELCTQAGKPELAAKFCESDKSVADVQTELFNALCEQNPPVGDEEGEGEDLSKEDARFVEEFKSNPEYSKSMSQEEYVSMRRVDEGLDVLEAPMNVS